jgi:type I restriction enzyme M protein
MSEEQRRALQNQLWSICCNLRGHMNGNEFQNYILGFIFYKFLSEKVTLLADDTLEGAGFCYAELTPETENYSEYCELIDTETHEALGYVLSPEQIFSHLIGRIKNDRDAFIINDLQSTLDAIESSTRGTEAAEDFVHLFEDMDLNSSKLGKTPDERNEMIKDILVKLSEIDFRLDDTESDVLGDSYEFLISKFAATSGSAAGEFYTPQKVSEILARAVSIGKTKIRDAYDPTCGSGSLLLSVAKHVETVGRYYGQELNRTTFNLARMNMILHDVHYKDFEIKQDNTLTTPQHMDKKFEAIVSNPPFSLTWDANKLLLNDDRYSPYGTLAPKDKADMAFIQHNLHHLDDKGTAAVVVPNGVLFRSGAEGKIRKHIISEMNALDAVIGLPAGLFSGTGIPAAILIFKKCRQDSENVLFIDASAHFEKGKNQNLLRNSDVDKIIETLTSRETIEKYSQLVPVSDIADNDFNLNVPRYVDTTEKEAEIDAQAVQVEINAVNDEIATLETEMAGYLEELGYDS